MYDVALWSHFKAGSLLKLQSCYHKCIKSFFGYKRSDSLTGLETGLPSFNTIVYNSRYLFHNSQLACTNLLLECLKSLDYDSRLRAYYFVLLYLLFECVCVCLVLSCVCLFFFLDFALMGYVP